MPSRPHRDEDDLKGTHVAGVNTMSSKPPHTADRSDAAVFGEARKALDDCPTVPGTVRVHVDDGVVTLTGSVQWPSQRADAEHAVRAAIGNRRLLNEITIPQVPSAEGFEAPDERG
jgi:osmotically-inducible protein OsmY